MHVVFYSCDYPDYSAAQNRPQGLAVLAVLFEVTTDITCHRSEAVCLISTVMTVDKHTIACVYCYEGLEKINRITSDWEHQAINLTTP